MPNIANTTHTSDLNVKQIVYNLWYCSYTIGIYRVAHGLEKCQQEFYFCMENSAMDAATTTVFEPSNPAT